VYLSRGHWATAKPRITAAETTLWPRAEVLSGDGRAPGLGPQLAFGDDVEVDALDLVGAGRHDIDKQRLDVDQRARLDRERGWHW
jgi:hypothetical protein